MAGTRARRMYCEAWSRLNLWKQRGKLLITMGLMWPEMCIPVVCLLVMTADQCRRHYGTMRDLRLTNVGSDRVLTLEDCELRHVTSANLMAKYRFDLEGLQALEENIGLPEFVRLGGHVGSGRFTAWTTVVSRTEILLITLDRLHSGTTLKKMGDEYGLQTSTVSSVFNYGLQHINETFGNALGDIRRFVYFMHLPFMYIFAHSPTVILKVVPLCARLGGRCGEKNWWRICERLCLH